MDLRMEMRNRDACPLRRGLCGRNGGSSLEEDDARAFIVNNCGRMSWTGGTETQRCAVTARSMYMMPVTRVTRVVGVNVRVAVHKYDSFDVWIIHSALQVAGSVTSKWVPRLGTIRIVFGRTTGPAETTA